MALNDLIPDPNAPPPSMNVSAMPGGLPQLGTPLLPLVGLNQRGQQEQGLQNRISSYENPQKPQGFWQNVRHIAATIGNVAGDVVAPSTMALIPGTQLHNHIQNTQNVRELAGLQGEDTAESTAASENALHSAQTGEAAARTAGMQQEQADKPSVDAADIAYKNAQAAALLHPTAKTEFDAWSAQNPGKPIAEWLKLKADSSPEKAGNDFEQYYKQYITDNNLPDSAHNRLLARKEYSAANQAPQRPPITNVLIPNAQGGYDVQGATAGSHIAPGAVSVSGMNSIDTPTSQSRNMAEMAKTVLPQMSAISNEVDQMASSIGPAVGRWNDLMVNKGGKDFPAFAKLDTDLDLLASAIVRTHFGARGGQQYREELRKQFGEAQSPEDLKARIAGANSWLQGYAHMAAPAGQGGQAISSPSTTDNGLAVGTIQKGDGGNYRFKGGDRYDKNNWEKVK